ncbi:4682_t:CDS:1, partial [Entrophospora sp. SA101]
ARLNVVADALSCLPHLANVSIISTQLDNHINWKEAYLNDNYFGPIWNILNNLENSDAMQQARARYFELQNGKINLIDGKRLAVPADKAL